MGIRAWLRKLIIKRFISPIEEWSWKELFDKFDDHIKSTIDNIEEDDLESYKKYLFNKIDEFKARRNRRFLLFVSLLLMQLLYVYGSELEVSIISVRLREPVWIAGLMFISSSILAIILGMLHIKYNAVLTIIENILTVNRHTKRLYLVPIFDNHSILGYISHSSVNPKAKTFHAIYKLIVGFVYLFYIIVIIYIEYITADKFILFIENDHLLYFCSLFAIAILIVTLILIGLLIVAQTLSRRGADSSSFP